MAGLEYRGSYGKMKRIKLGIGRVRNFMLPNRPLPTPMYFPPFLYLFSFFFKEKHGKNNL